MKLMVAFALASAPLWSQSFEAGLFPGRNSYRSNSLDEEPEARTVFAARLGYDLADFGPSFLEATTGFQPKCSTPVTLHGAGGPSPWVRARLGCALPASELKPFVGVELALPLSRSSARFDDGSTPDLEAQLKSHAPHFQLGLYGGLRF